MYTTVWTLTDKTPPASTLTSPTRYLVWLAGQQRRIIAISMVCGMISFLTQAVTPFAGGRAIDAGLNNGLTSTLMMWAGVMLAAALIQVIFGAIGHRHDTYSWIRAALTTSISPTFWCAIALLQQRDRAPEVQLGRHAGARSTIGKLSSERMPAVKRSSVPGAME